MAIYPKQLRFLLGSSLQQTSAPPCGALDSFRKFSLGRLAIKSISIYTLSDLGDLSNLIGSLSRTIQQYSPPREWIMCELGFFSHFVSERSFKSRQNPKVDFFFKQEKTSKRRFSIYCCWVLWSMDCLQLPFIRLEEAVSWTQRFLTRKIWPKNRSLFMTYKFESKCLQKLFFSISVNGGFRNIYLNIQPPFTSISKKSC